MAMQTGQGGDSGGMSREEFVDKTATDITKAISACDELKFLKDTVPTPLEVVLKQEIERFETLLKRMLANLSDLKRALKGEIGMSQSLEELLVSLFNGLLPGAWAKLAPQTEKPLGSWMDHFVRRHKQFNDWCINGDPAVFWLSGLHIPESLLSALVQASCRRRGWALDKSTLYTKVTKYASRDEVTEKLLDGTYVEGLYLEGARWDTEQGCLARQLPKQLIQQMPLVEVIPTEANRLKLRDELPTPVYVTQLRRNAMGVGLVFEANLHTKEHTSMWVLQGVALTLNDDTPTLARVGEAAYPPRRLRRTAERAARDLPEGQAAGATESAPRARGGPGGGARLSSAVCVLRASSRRVAPGSLGPGQCRARGEEGAEGEVCLSRLVMTSQTGSLHSYRGRGAHGPPAPLGRRGALGPVAMTPGRARGMSQEAATGAAAGRVEWRCACGVAQIDDDDGAPVQLTSLTSSTCGFWLGALAGGEVQLAIASAGDLGPAKEAIWCAAGHFGCFCMREVFLGGGIERPLCRAGGRDLDLTVPEGSLTQIDQTDAPRLSSGEDTVRNTHLLLGSLEGAERGYGAQNMQPLCARREVEALEEPSVAPAKPAGGLKGMSALKKGLKNGEVARIIDDKEAAEELEARAAASAPAQAVKAADLKAAAPAAAPVAPSQALPPHSPRGDGPGGRRPLRVLTRPGWRRGSAMAVGPGAHTASLKSGLSFYRRNIYKYTFNFSKIRL
ncbi:unnamed protein product [Prorocentrum cordatum]|uniref:Dynein heavy chain C-terminal domain-containing protein n=1 Tax=Prorocentrum cordatum TaxID=2364126 RepID=A0ABN9V5S9_9DINO|nr:unnamed protein product [Polarella glacialis]